MRKEYSLDWLGHSSLLCDDCTFVKRHSDVNTEVHDRQNRRLERSRRARGDPDSCKSSFLPPESQRPAFTSAHSAVLHLADEYRPIIFPQPQGKYCSQIKDFFKISLHNRCVVFFVQFFFLNYLLFLRTILTLCSFHPSETFCKN